jgi:two-component system chemotaxis response regulator CheY
MFNKDTLILIVDDMDSARGLLMSHVQGLGFSNIVEAQGGELAISMLQDMREIGSPVGLIISDWMMPGMSGLELLVKVRANPQTAKLPFLMVTAEGDAPQVVKAIQAGVTDYIVKPFNSELFHKKLKNVWAKTQTKAR